MSLPDRSKWPEGATHWSPATTNRLEAYWKPASAGSCDCWAITAGPRHWQQNDTDLPSYAVPLEVRPAAWNGEGLPPVGTVCDVFDCTHEYTKRFNNQSVEIVAHHRGLAVFAANDGEYHGLVAEKFRPIRAAEQIEAEEKRNLQIEQLASMIAGYMGFDDPREADKKLAVYLFDHDFRKQVKP